MSETVKQAPADNPNREIWYTVFGVGHPDLKKYQRFNMRLPSPPRCKLCYAPFHGIGKLVMRFQGREPSNKNPRYCSRCDQFLRKFPGGAEVDMTLMFLDVRGSSALADKMSAMDFSRVMKNFYAGTFPVINETDGFINDVRGDGLFVVYPPGFSGPDHAHKAMRAAETLLRKTIAAPDGTPIRFGMGIHTGIAYIGTMTGAEAGVEDVTVLGDAPNVAAHLCSSCRPGEALVSEAACAAAGLDLSRLEPRKVDLKGKPEPVTARVVKPAA